MAKNEFPLDEILAMQYRFATLYRTTGLISICDSYIQVRLGTLARLCNPEAWTVTVNLKMSYPVQCSTMIEGVKFCSVGVREEVEKVGLVLTAEQLVALEG